MICLSLYVIWFLMPSGNKGKGQIPATAGKMWLREWIINVLASQLSGMCPWTEFACSTPHEHSSNCVHSAHIIYENYKARWHQQPQRRDLTKKHLRGSGWKSRKSHTHLYRRKHGISSVIIHNSKQMMRSSAFINYRQSPKIWDDICFRCNSKEILWL